MYVVVHAGMEKTGSSSLQEYMDRYRDQLREIGVIYPSLGHRSHWAFAAALGGPKPEDHYFERRLQRDALLGSEGDLLNGVRSVILEAKPNEVVVLSHESLGKLQQCAKLRDYLSDCGVGNSHLHILAYVRKPDEHFPSAVQQGLKSTRHDAKSPDRWVSHHPATAKGLLNTFGPMVDLRAYARDTLVEGDIVSDFAEFMAKRFGIILPLPHPRITRNASLSGEGCALLEFAKQGRGRSLREREFTRLRVALFNFDRELGRTRLKIPEDWNSWISVANRDLWNPLVEQLPYSETIKRRLRLDDAVPSKPVSKADVKSWIASYYNPDYASELARMWRETPKNEVPRGPDILAWLVETPRWVGKLG